MTTRTPQAGEPSSPKELAPVRVASRAAFSGILRDFLKLSLAQGSSYVSSWASILGVGESTVRNKWADPLDRAAIAAGDLHALPPAELAELLRFWLARVETSVAPVAAATDPRLLVVQLAEAIGDLAKRARKAMADRRVTEPEWKDLEAQFAQIERDAREARLACEAARRAGGAR